MVTGPAAVRVMMPFMGRPFRELRAMVWSGQPGGRGSQQPVVGGQERQLPGDGPVAQHGDDRPWPEPDGLVGDSSGGVQVEDVDALLGMSLDDAVPVLDDLVRRGEAGQVSAHALDAADKLV